MHHGLLSFACIVGVAACGQVSDGSAPMDGSSVDGPPIDHPANDGPSDGGPSATACIGKPFPTTAAPILNFEGKVLDAGDDTPIDFAVLRLIRGTTEEIGGATDGLGRYGGQMATDGTAVDAHFEVIAMTASRAYVSESIYPSRPFTVDDVDRIIRLSTDARMQLLYTGSGLTWDGTAGYILVAIVDCAGAPIANAQIALSPTGGTPRYVRPVTDPNATETDESGLVEILNRPPGRMTITATAPAPFTQLHSYTIDVDANTVHTIDIQP
jgi:hypothetical protein